MSLSKLQKPVVAGHIPLTLLIAKPAVAGHIPLILLIARPAVAGHITLTFLIAPPHNNTSILLRESRHTGQTIKM